MLIQTMPVNVSACGKVSVSLRSRKSFLNIFALFGNSSSSDSRRRTVTSE
jgi:hypothetical protein